jgi:prepilin-type N-terminal cleavage/methylation domain-containing protein
MNNKGFTLIELLAIITILGIIAGIAIPAYQHYVFKTRNAGYKTLITTIRTAAQNKYIDDGITGDLCSEYSIEDLYKEGYMDKPSDPANTSTSCSGKVFIRPAHDDYDVLMENYEINVSLKCSTYQTNDCVDNGGNVCTFTESQMSGCLLR